MDQTLLNNWYSHPETGQKSGHAPDQTTNRTLVNGDCYRRYLRPQVLLNRVPEQITETSLTGHRLTITSTAIRSLVGAFTTSKVAMFPWSRKQHGTGFLMQLVSCSDHFKRDSPETQLSDSVSATSLIIRCFLS